MSTKSADALKTISEASALIDVPPHVLRFWEGKFISLRPLKRSGGRRYYRPNDIALLWRIRKLLYVDGFTIKGAQKLLRGKASSNALVESEGNADLNEQTIAAAITILDDVKKRLAELKQKLDSKKNSVSCN